MTQRSRLLVLGLALAGLVALAYANHFDNSFHFDDSHVIEDNAFIRDLGNLPSFFTDPATVSALPTNREYRPVLTTTFAIDYALGSGLDPFMFHVTSLLIHLGVAVLAAVLFRRVIDTAMEHPANPFVAMLLAGWFAIHTVSAETVNYITARSDSLSTLFVLAALVTYTRTRGPARHWAYMPLGLGILTKASAVIFVPILVVYELLFVERIALGAVVTSEGRRSAARVLRRTMPALLVSVSFFALFVVMTPDTSTLGGTSVLGYLITQPFVILRYFWTFFVPVGLSADTDWTLLDSVFDVRFLVGIAFIAAAIYGAFLASRRKETRPIAFGIIWFFLALVPTSSVVALAEVTNDHRMYFPFVGLTLAVGWAIALLAYRYQEALIRTRGALVALWVGVAVVLGAHALGTWERNQVWDTDESLWYDVTVKSPGNGRGLMNYGNTQMAQGRFDVALDYFERALDSDYGNHPYLYINLGLATDAVGDTAGAEGYFLGALARGNGFPATQFYYARWLVDQGRITEAHPYLDAALTQSPGYEPALALREYLFGLYNLVAEAEAAAIAVPTPDNLVELSRRYYNAGRYEESIGAAEQALLLDATNHIAFNNICASNNRLERYLEAVAACNAALELVPDYELARNNLAFALANLEESE